MTDHIDTGGGAAIHGHLDIHSGTFIGRDQIVVISGYTGEQLEQVLVRLGEILPGGRAVLRVDPATEQLAISAPDAPHIVLAREPADRLESDTARQSTENAYLTSIRVSPRYGCWATQFVPLAGKMTPPPHAPGWTDVPPAYTLVESHGEGASRQLRRIQLEDITEATARHPALALTGAPGSGKSTTLYKLALDAAIRRQETGEGRLPLYLPLSDYHGATTPFDFVKTRFEQRVQHDDLAQRLRHGDLLLLLDALNEMPADDQRDYGLRVGAWRRFIEEWPGNQVIVSCRSRDYHEKLGIPEVEIDPLDETRVQDFLHRYLPQPGLAETTWQRLQGGTLQPLISNPYYLNMLTTIVGQGGTWPASQARLFAGFVEELLQREQERHHADWPGEGPLIAALKQVAETIQPLGAGTSLPRPEFLKRIPSLVPGDDGPVTLSPGVVLRLGLAATVLDTEKPAGEEKVRFYHHQLQEYFAAQALVDRFRGGEDLSGHWRAARGVNEMPDPGPLGDYEPLPPPPTTGWEEPTILAAGLVPDVAAFVTAVQAVNPVLAARCLSESGLAPPASLMDGVQKGLLSELGDRNIHLRARLAAGDALGRLGDPRFTAMTVDGQRVVIPPLVRIPAGTWQIGSSGWEVWQLARKKFSAEDERPRHPVTLADYWVGQYPVTNGEWACFMEAGGYQDLAHWEMADAQAWLQGAEASGPIGEWMDTWRVIREDPTRMQRWGWTSRSISNWTELIQMDEDEFRSALTREYGNRRRDQPHYWDDARFNNLSQPVVGITWFEARAYCHWLDGMLRQAQAEGLLPGEMLPAGYAVRLPTEAQWERAARGPQGWRYPWGNGWDAGKANSFEGYVLRTNAVGAYPEGVSAEGAYDLSGNVWEWTLSQYQEYPIRANDGRNAPEGDTRRVVRGGSWGYDRRNVRAAYRFGDVPGLFDNDLGLRVVVSLSSGF